MQQCSGEAMVRNGSGVGGSAVRKGSSANASANASGADFGMLAPHSYLVGSLIGIWEVLGFVFGGFSFCLQVLVFSLTLLHNGQVGRYIV